MDRVPFGGGCTAGGLFLGVQVQQLQNDAVVGQSLHFGWAWRDSSIILAATGVVSQVIPVFVIVGASFVLSPAPC